MTRKTDSSTSGVRFTLGLDVSKQTIDACLLGSDGSKEFIKIANSRDGFLELMRFLDGVDLEQLHACLEPTGRYSRPILDFLYSIGIKTSLVGCTTAKDQAKVKNIRNKTDKIDCFLLADYCMMHNPAAWAPPTQGRLELRDVQNRLANVIEEIQQEENRLEAGLESDFVREDIEENLGRLYVRRKKLESFAKKLIQNNPKMDANFKILKSIVGIGEASAVLMLAVIDFPEFSSGRKIGAFAGLNPVTKESGTSIRCKPQISRAGSPRLRRALYFPAMVAMQHNPQLRAFADRLKAKSKNSKVIICAVMRKLLVLAGTLIRKQEFYDPAYNT